MGFIEDIAPLVQKHIAEYGIKVSSPIIAQAVLESASGTSSKAQYHNYFGLKYRANRVDCHSGIFYDGGSEQNKDGSYTNLSNKTAWYSFANMEDGVIGYLQFINTSNYKNLKGVTDPKQYLELIKSDGYATSLKYVDKVMNVIDKYDLRKYDNIKIEEGVKELGYKLKVNYANKSNYGGSRSASKIKYIVIHYTANDGDTDEANAKYFKRKNIKASAHYFVDDDSVTMSVPDTIVAWSVGGGRYKNYKSTGGAKYYWKCTNTNSISIEMCDTIKDGKIMASEKTMQNTAELVKTLMAKYNVPIENVIRHFDVTGKACPAYFVDQNAWNGFKARLSTVTPRNDKNYGIVFNATYYANKYPDLKNAFGYNHDKLLNHFLNNGIKESRQACSSFYVIAYKNNNPDLQKAFGNNLVAYVDHYLTFGYKENRKTI